MSDTFPRISVITVCFNSAKTIERTIKSVIAQNYANLEYIIIDGASTDGTVDIIRKYSKYITKWVSEPDDGIFYAMNKGIALSTGEYFNFLNSDDWFCNGALNRVAEYIKRFNADVYYGNVIRVSDKERNVSTPRPLESTYWCIPCNHQTTFVKKEDGLLFDTKYRISADYNMLYNLYFSGKSFCYIPYELVHYYTGGFSADMSYTRMDFTAIASEGLLKQEDKIAVYRPIIANLVARSISYRMYMDGEIDDLVVDYINRKFPDDKRKVLFCTGDILERFWRVIDKAGIEIEYFVDNNKKLYNTLIHGITIRTPDSLREDKNLIICIMTDKYRDEVWEQLDSMGLDESVDIVDYVSLQDEFIELNKEIFVSRAIEKIEPFKKLMEWKQL